MTNETTRYILSGKDVICIVKVVIKKPKKFSDLLPEEQRLIKLIVYLPILLIAGGLTYASVPYLVPLVGEWFTSLIISIYVGLIFIDIFLIAWCGLGYLWLVFKETMFLRYGWFKEEMRSRMEDF